MYERLFLAAKPFTAAILKALALSRRDRDLDLYTDTDCLKDLQSAPVKAPSPSPVLKPVQRAQTGSKLSPLSSPSTQYIAPRGDSSVFIVSYILLFFLLFLFVLLFLRRFCSYCCFVIFRISVVRISVVYVYVVYMF